MLKCPCCGKETLTERGVYEICAVCNWEDDGQDDYDADVVRGGPNYTYHLGKSHPLSLTEGRENYKNHGHSQGPGWELI
jgi:hypothetical protein